MTKKRVSQIECGVEFLLQFRKDNFSAFFRNPVESGVVIAFYNQTDETLKIEALGETLPPRTKTLIPSPSQNEMDFTIESEAEYGLMTSKVYTLASQEGGEQDLCFVVYGNDIDRIAARVAKEVGDNSNVYVKFSNSTEQDFRIGVRRPGDTIPSREVTVEAGNSEKDYFEPGTRFSIIHPPSVPERATDQQPGGTGQAEIIIIGT
jgi:hypothetical protein